MLAFKAAYTTLFEIDMDFTVNEKTKAGSMDYFIQDKKIVHYNWDAKGNGSTMLYNEDGSISYQVDWTI